MARMLRPATAGVIAIVLFVGAACSSNAASPASSGDSSTPPPTHSSQTSAPVRQSNNQFSTADLVKFAEPAVVRIQTGGGVGTGFLVSADGFLMTNNHVVQSGGTSRTNTAASEIQVTLSDGTTKSASVVGTDERSDLALLKIEGSGYPFLKFATLENTNVGDSVIAIGFALDIGTGNGAPTVTEGIVSAKNRAINEGSTTQGGLTVLGSIQTDAAINHGNSGGPLLNLSGEVVGINTSLVPDTESGGVASGIGLAVGADTANAVFGQLRDSGRVNRGLLGISSFQAMRPAQAKALGIPTDAGGIYLPTDQELAAAGSRLQPASSVQAGGPADQGGIKPGDVITKLADQAVHDESELAVALINHHPNEKVKVEVYRGGKQQILEVTLGTPS